MSEPTNINETQESAGLDLPSEKNIYFNGFLITIGLGDISIILHQDGKPIYVLRTSYIVAKTLAQKIGALIDILETRTGQPVLTTDAVLTSLIKEER
jgi:hypothetical protein